MSARPKLAAAAALVALVAMPAFAHHSFAMFDRGKTGSVSGTVRTVEWTNPHVWLWVDVPDGKGSMTPWGFEGAAPGELLRQGWKKDGGVVKGEKITVYFAPLRDGRNGGSLQKIITADGTTISVHVPGAPLAPSGPLVGSQ